MKGIKFRKYTLLVSIIVSTSIVFTECGNNKSDTNEVKNVKTVTINTSSIENYTEYGSILKPQSEVSVSPKISGKVESINVEVSQQVKKGDVLFTLESKELQAQYNQAQAALSSAQANLTRTSDSALTQQLIQAQSSQNLAQNVYDDAKSSFDKAKVLYDAEAVSKQDLDNAQSKFSSAEIQLNSANDTLNLLNNKLGSQTTDIAKAQVDQAKAAVDLAKAQLDNTTITSPIDGVISKKDVNPGEIVSSSKSAISIIDANSLIGEINIPNEDLSGLASEQKVEVKVNSLENKSFDGVVDNISPSADSKTQLYNVKVKLINTDVSLKSGMVIKILLPNEKKDNILAVQSKVIIVDNGVQYVYVVVDNTVKKLPVGVGISDSKYTEITSGLELGDNVIIEGQSFLTDGDKVNISNS